MNRPKRIPGVLHGTLVLLLVLSGGQIVSAASNSASAGNPLAETLNPEGVNPHREAPRKTISQEKKQAAADARKRKQKEHAARKAAQQGQVNATDPGAAPSGASRDSVNR